MYLVKLKIIFEYIHLVIVQVMKLLFYSYHNSKIIILLFIIQKKFNNIQKYFHIFLFVYSFFYQLEKGGNYRFSVVFFL